MEEVQQPSKKNETTERVHNQPSVEGTNENNRNESAKDDTAVSNQKETNTHNPSETKDLTVKDEDPSQGHRGRKLRCRFCTKTFRVGERREFHERMHSRMFNCCSVCGKSFCRIGNLKIHMTTHRNKSLCCDRCNCLFSNYKSLRTHYIAKHGIRLGVVASRERFLRVSNASSENGRMNGVENMDQGRSETLEAVSDTVVGDSQASSVTYDRNIQSSMDCSNLYLPPKIPYGDLMFSSIASNYGPQSSMTSNVGYSLPTLRPGISLRPSFAATHGGMQPSGFYNNSRFVIPDIHPKSSLMGEGSYPPSGSLQTSPMSSSSLQSFFISSSGIHPYLMSSRGSYPSFLTPSSIHQTSSAILNHSYRSFGVPNGQPGSDSVQLTGMPYNDHHTSGVPNGNLEPCPVIPDRGAWQSMMQRSSQNPSAMPDESSRLPSVVPDIGNESNSATPKEVPKKSSTISDDGDTDPQTLYIDVTESEIPAADIEESSPSGSNEERSVVLNEGSNTSSSLCDNDDDSHSICVDVTESSTGSENEPDGWTPNKELAVQIKEASEAKVVEQTSSSKHPNEMGSESSHGEASAENRETKESSIKSEISADFEPGHDMAHKWAESSVSFDCRFCSKHFSDPVAFWRHKHKHAYSCNLCSFSSASHKFLAQHFLVYHPELLSFVCSCCNKSFAAIGMLSYHAQVHFDNLFSCDFCQEHFKTDEALYYHEQCHSGEVMQEKPDEGFIFSCKICSYMSDSEYKLRFHMFHHKGRKLFFCSLCSTQFTFEPDLALHLKDCHGAVEKFVCSDCQCGHASKEEFDRHSCCIEKMFQCMYCGLRFFTSHVLLAHQESHWGLLRLQEGQLQYEEAVSRNKNCSSGRAWSEFKYNCSQCEVGFFQRHLLHIHNRLHMYKCSICQRMFLNPDDLSEHVYDCPLRGLHYTCGICEKNFFGMSDLTLHIKTHDGIKPLVCDICGKLFCQRANLNSHKQLHLKKKIHHCSLCNQSFAQPATFNAHMAIHKYPHYFCSACKTIVRESYELKSHMKKEHHTSRYVVCVECRYTFLEEDSLKEHACNKGITNLCFQCGELFSSEELLKDHKASHEFCSFGKPAEKDSTQFSESPNQKDELVSDESSTEDIIVDEPPLQNARTIVNDMETLGRIKPLEEENPVVLTNESAIGKRIITDIQEQEIQEDKSRIVPKVENPSSPSNQAQESIAETLKPFSTANDMTANSTEEPFNKSIMMGLNMSHQRRGRRRKMFKTKGKDISFSYICSICKLPFVKTIEITRHTREFHNPPTVDTPFECSICEKQFKKVGQLRLHIRIHTGERPFDCKFCPKRFTQQSNLLSHERMHMGDKPYECRLCGKRFVQSSNLKCHIRTHIGNIRHHCTVCKERKSSSKDLKMHLSNVHSAPKPCVCGGCLGGFLDVTPLEQHPCGSGITNFCFTCGDGFPSRAELMNHKKLHRILSQYEGTETKIDQGNGVKKDIKMNTNGDMKMDTDGGMKMNADEDIKAENSSAVACENLLKESMIKTEATGNEEW